jgi:hypothetical protein
MLAQTGMQEFTFTNRSAIYHSVFRFRLTKEQAGSLFYELRHPSSVIHLHHSGLAFFGAGTRPDLLRVIG